MKIAEIKKTAAGYRVTYPDMPETCPWNKNIRRVFSDFAKKRDAVLFVTMKEKRLPVFK